MASLELRFDAQEIGMPLEPDIDDFGRANVVIASRRNGGEATAEDKTGPLGTDAIGRYSRLVDINPQFDGDLPQHASYHLMLGTDPDPRFPQVVVDLDANPQLVAAASALDIGDRLGPRKLPPGLGQPEADVLVLGYTEVIESHHRMITFNGGKGGILSHVGKLNGGATACLQTAGPQLGGAITAEQTSFTVATTAGPLFTTAPPTGARIIVRDREIMTVSSISGSSSPQTFTVVRDPDRRMAHPAGASVRVYRALRVIL